MKLRLIGFGMKFRQTDFADRTVTCAVRRVDATAKG